MLLHRCRSGLPLLVIVLACALFSAQVLWDVADAASIHHLHRHRRRAIRLCSSNLSDAMFLLCKNRGFNDPFGSGESGGRSKGPGLVEECCYNACTIEQMEAYCKPATPKPPAR